MGKKNPKLRRIFFNSSGSRYFISNLLSRKKNTRSGKEEDFYKNIICVGQKIR